jgi:3-oxoadipate enol-lactonase
MPQQRTITTGQGVSIHTELEGEGPPVVWVAGLGDDSSSWERQVADFRDEYLCVTFDNRGIGRSSVPPGPYTISAMAQDAHDVVAGLGIAPVIAVGSSMGGAICQRWAAQHPQDVRGLVLTNTWGRSDGFLHVLFEHWIGLAGPSRGQGGEQGGGQGGGELLRSLLLFSYGADFLAARPDVSAGFLSSDPPGLDGFTAAAQACRDHDALRVLGAITAPALVIVGEDDILTRPALGRDLAARLPDAALATVAAGHMLFWERPEEFAALVREFLRYRVS